MQFSKKKYPLKSDEKQTPCTKNETLIVFTLRPLVWKQVGLQYPKSLIMYGYCAYPAMSKSSFKNCQILLKRSETSEILLKRSETGEILLKRSETREILLKRSETGEILLKKSETSEILLKRSETGVFFLSFSYTSLYINQEPGD